jgi:HK97 family phage major capsid protein
MQSIQQFRQKRADLAAQARKILDTHPGDLWTKDVERSVDAIYAEIETVDRMIEVKQKRLNKEAGQAFGGSGAGVLSNPDTGKDIPVAYSKNGKISAQLADAFPENISRGEELSIADFLRGVAGLRTTEAFRNSLTEGTDSQGGYTLPAYTQGQMLDALAPVSALMKAGAGIAMLEQGAKSYRIAATTTIPTAAWRAESGAVATSDPAFRSVDLIPRSLAFQFKVSRELLSDAQNIEAALLRVISQAFAKELDRAGLRGSGTPPEIRGILNTSGIQAVTNGANGASLATTAYANLISADQAILAADGPDPAAAIMSPRSLMVLAGLLDTTNQPRRVPVELEDWNLVATSQIPNNLTVGTSNDCSEIYVGDFSSIIYFIREAVSIQMLRELYAGTGEIGFLAHVRVDLGVTYPAAIGVVTGVRP